MKQTATLTDVPIKNKYNLSHVYNWHDQMKMGRAPDV